MKVEGPAAGRPTGVRGKSRTGATAGADFANSLSQAAGGSSAAGGATPVGPVGALDAVVAVQSVDDATTGRRRAARRGKDILDQLDRLRVALLTGQLEAEQIRRLAALVESRRDGVDDPALSAVLEEIDLRAQVELAKLEAALAE